MCIRDRRKEEGQRPPAVAAVGRHADDEGDDHREIEADADAERRAEGLAVLLSLIPISEPTRPY